MSGIVYRFKNQNIVTFEKNLKNMGDVPFAAFFGTTT